MQETGLCVELKTHFVDDANVLCAQGSYFTQEIPEEIEYLSIVITNTSSLKRTLVDADFHICTYGEDGETVFAQPLNIDFPKANYYGKKLKSCEKITFAVLREHLVRNIRYKALTSKVFLRASCEILDGRKAYSDLYELDLNYPDSPLQDIELIDFYPLLKQEQTNYLQEVKRIKSEYGSLEEYASLHKEIGILPKIEQGEKYWLCREYAPDATEIFLVYDSDNFGNRKSFEYLPEGNGYWAVKVPYDTFFHSMFYELHVYGKYLQGKQIRVPAFANWLEQNKDNENQWSARFWLPEQEYIFKNKKISHNIPVIYEAHVGIAKHNLDKSSENERGFGTYKYFTEKLLPMIKEAGFNTIQLMGIPEHPLYKSFGYQVSSYFAPSHRFGTIDEFKELVDTAHALEISVLLDIVHSHSCPNTEQGLPRYDTGDFLFCSDRQTQWGTTFFDYDKEITRRFLLSNCRYWQEEFQIDGFRFDAVGSMVFTDEGFSDDFTHVSACFYTKSNEVRRNRSGILYLQLANTLIHEIDEQAITIAEEFSGTPGITSSPSSSGLGFDFRFAMGIPDLWAKYIENPQPMWKLWHECTNSRIYDKTISYVECHDQCINGEDAMIWRMIGKDMYFYMSPLNENWNVSRGVALNKLMKLLVFMSADKGYMSFMGNEFGHPEWIDAEVNPYRQWHLKDDNLLHYKGLDLFNKDMFLLLFSDIDSFFDSKPRVRLIDEDSRIILFERAGYICAYNFHELRATKLKAMVSPGKYKEIFSTDEQKYSGHNNLTTIDNVDHFTCPQSGEYEQEIQMYLPPLTALILEKNDKA